MSSLSVVYIGIGVLSVFNRVITLGPFALLCLVMLMFSILWSSDECVPTYLFGVSVKACSVSDTTCSSGTLLSFSTPLPLVISLGEGVHNLVPSQTQPLALACCCPSPHPLLFPILQHVVAVSSRLFCHGSGGGEVVGSHFPAGWCDGRPSHVEPLFRNGVTYIMHCHKICICGSHR